MKKNFFKNYFGNESDNSDVNRTKFIDNRIKIVQKFIPQIDKSLFDYIEKNAKSRDSLDKVAIVLENYSKEENVNTALKLQLSGFAEILLDVGSCWDAKVNAMETKVLEQLVEYKKLCKFVRTELKLSLIASDKERNWSRQLKRMKESHPEDHQQISIAEAEFLKARGESSRSSKNLEEQIDDFEKKKLNTLKEALLAWTMAELRFHSKALQLFTDAYRTAADINVNSDVEEFRNKLRSTEATPRFDSSERSDSILQMLTLPFPFHRKNKFTGSGIPHPCSTPSSSQCSRSSVSSQGDSED